MTLDCWRRKSEQESNKWECKQEDNEEEEESALCFLAEEKSAQ